MTWSKPPRHCGQFIFSRLHPSASAPLLFFSHCRVELLICFVVQKRVQSVHLYSRNVALLMPSSLHARVFISLLLHVQYVLLQEITQADGYDVDMFLLWGKYRCIVRFKHYSQNVLSRVSK